MPLAICAGLSILAYLACCAGWRGAMPLTAAAVAAMLLAAVAALVG